MTSKLDRWKKLSAAGTNTDEIGRTDSKREILTGLSTFSPKGEGDQGETETGEEGQEGKENPSDNPTPSSDSESVGNNHTTDSSVESGSTNHNPTISVGSGSTNNTPSVGVQDSGNAASDAQPPQSPKPPKPRDRSSKQENLAHKVNSNVVSFIQNKITKEDTHKKTSFLLTLRNLAKLELFDKAHGGRIKGEFINNLLEEAFTELEKDSQWKKILNADLDRLMAQIAGKQ